MPGIVHVAKRSKEARGIKKRSLLRMVNARLKRLFDILLAVMGLILGAPLIALIAFFIYVESPGPVIFTQIRLGRYGKRFRMHKFRKFPAHWKDAGPGVTAACDARMTRVGAWLERLKFDELPQLWNILKGEMSFVGPRPESTRFADLFSGRYAAVLDHLPGIFGPNQVAFRNECEMYPADEDPEMFYRRVLFPQKAENDLAYFARANVFSDVLWMVKGIWVSLSGVLNWKRFLGLHSKILLTDVLAVGAAWSIANVTRFTGLPEGQSLEILITGLWLLPLVILSGMFLAGCYLRPVRYFSLGDAIRLTQAASFGLFLGFLVLIKMYRNIALSLLPISLFALLPLLALPRVFARTRWEKEKSKGLQTSRKIALYGAGRCGTALASWIKNGILVGFLDDDPNLLGKLICGCKVLGRECDIPTVHEVHGFQELWVTFIPDMEKKRRLQEICAQRSIDLFIIRELEPFARLVIRGDKVSGLNI